MMRNTQDGIHGGEELEALELGHRVAGWCAVADLYPEAAGNPASVWYQGC